MCMIRNRWLTLRLVVVVILFAISGVAQPKKKTGSKPCATTLSACGEIGCAKSDSADALANKFKRNIPSQHAARVLTMDDFEKLQELADTLVGQHVSLREAKRSKLKDLSVSNGTVAEGDFVEVQGFLVGVPHPNKKESVNCRLIGSKNNDFHLTLARTANDSDFEGIVVEMIPQGRDIKWTIPRLNRIEQQKSMVRVRGSLFYDNKHSINDDEDNPMGGQPPRFSLWEVHPITEFDVCTTPPCSDSADGWVKLADLNLQPQ
jgi:hypothetical protein